MTRIGVGVFWRTPKFSGGGVSIESALDESAVFLESFSDMKSSSVPVVQLTRPPLERMMRIHQAVAEGKYPNATSLAAQIEVATKTIQRDIEFMRDRLPLPIEYDPRPLRY